jgi:hypothetical protein
VSQTKVLSVRVEKDLYQEVADVAAVSGLSLRDLVESGLKREMNERRGDDALDRALSAVRTYREKIDMK